jgi:acetyl esterase/lipase
LTAGKTRKVILRVIAWAALALGLPVFAAHFLTPWPGVLLIRAIFDKGAADASAKLEKHVPGGIVANEAVRYDSGDPTALLDVYRPEQLNRQAPTIVWVHGGGFVSGRRGDLTNYLKVLSGQGFATVSVDYTLAPTATYPTPVRQVSRALAFLVREGDRLGINPNALVIAGDSAGAQIAAQTANVVTSPAYAQQVGIEVPIAAEKLKGALLYCGIYDVTQLNPDQGGFLGWFVRTVTWAYSGKRNWSDAPGFEQMSVAREVTSQFPATFISAGNADPLGPQSVLMDNALRKAGVPVHSLFYPPDHEPKLGHEYQSIWIRRMGKQRWRSL